MKITPLAAITALSLGLSGCASLVEGTTQSISVMTPPHNGAACVLTSTEGIYNVTTPGDVVVHKTRNPLEIVCSKPGFKDGHAVLSPRFSKATVGNILIGGVVGVGIDAATGADFHFPDEVSIALVPEGAVPLDQYEVPGAAPVKPSS